MTNLLIPDLIPNTQYAVEVRAVRTNGVSEWSARKLFTTVSDTVLPLAPVNVTWAVSGDGFSGSWDTSTLNVNAEVINIVRYEVELTAAAQTKILSVPQTTGSSVLFILSFEENRAMFGSPQPTVGMRVRAVSNIDTKSAWTSILSASNPVPGNPFGIVATAGQNQIQLAWSAPTGPSDNDIVGYNVYYLTTKLGFVNATSYVFYTSGYSSIALTVKSVDKFGQESTGANSNAVTPLNPSTLDTTAPSTPTSLAATITNNANGLGARAAVSWVMTSPPSDLAGYYIRFRRVGDTNYSVVPFTKDVLAGIIELQAAYTNYEFQINAYDWSNNTSGWSTTVTATSPANSVPTSISSITSSPMVDSILYTWTPVSDADLKNYEVTFSTSATFASGNITFFTGTAATLTVGGLSPSTLYYARVRAIDTASQPSSAWSTTNTTTTSTVIIGVKAYSIEYSLNASETVAPTTGWSTTPPTRTPGNFIWTRTVITYDDNTTSTTAAVLLTGNTGATGSTGSPAAQIDLTATSQVLSSPAAGGATTPATSTVTGVGTNTTITAWTYSVDGAAFSATVPAGVSRTGNVVTITGSTMTAKTIAVKMADAAGIADTLTVAKVADGAAGGTGTAGNDGYTVLLSNESQTFPAGTTNALAGSTTSTVMAYKGTVLQSATVGTITGGATGITAAVTNNGTTAPLITFTVTTALTTNNGTFIIPITVGGITFNQVFSWSLAFTGAQGTAGTSATSVEVGNDAVAIPVTAAGAALSAGSITIPFSGWIGTTRAAATLATSALPAGITLGSNTAATSSADGSLVLNYAAGATIGAADTGNITLTITCNSIAFTNLFSWTRAYTGAAGGAGSPGTSATSLDTTPDVFMVPTDSAGAALSTSSVVVNFKGFVGATSSAVTIGAAPTLPAGITATPSGSGTTNAFITFNWTAAATIGAAASGTFAWPLTINGISFTANIGWARALQGTTGGTGATGKGVSSITPYFLQQTVGAGTPATPVVSPPTGSWVTTEPTYTTNTELWRTERIIYTDATFAYTTPTKVSSYAAAAQAITSANGKNTITYSTVAPVNGTNTGILGDTWFVRDATTLNIKAQYELTTAPSTWTARSHDSLLIASLDAGKLTAGTITAQTIQVSNTGAIQSTDYVAATTGWKLSTAGLEINSGSVKASALTAGTLGSSTGVIQIGAGASLVFNGGYLKSNTYTVGGVAGTAYSAAATAGFYLGNDGLVIAQGTVKAEAFAGGSFTAGTITMGAGGSITGGSWTLNSSGLTIPNGAISAAALNIQMGANLMPAKWADFEGAATSYPTLPAVIGVSTLMSNAISTAQKYTNNQSMNLINTAGATRGWLFAPTFTEYNVKVNPSTRYLVSAYLYNNSGVAVNGYLGIKQQDGTYVNGALTSYANTAGWVRYTTVVSTTAAASTAVVTFTLAASGNFYIDAIQIEQAINATVTSPSPWSPPGSTTIDGSIIRTGSIESTATNLVWDITSGTYIAGTDPAWSIDMQGSAEFGNLNVIGSAVIGDPSDSANASKSVIGSAFYQPGTFGWIMRGDGVVEFNQVTANSINGSSIKAGTLSADRLTAGNLGSDISVVGGGGFTIWDAAGTNQIIKINPTVGLLIDPPGDGYISVPSNGSAVQIKNVSLSATDAQFSGNVSISGANNYISGDLMLEKSVSDPVSAPTVISGWADATTYFSTTPPSGFSTFGLTEDAAGTSWVTGIFAAGNAQIWKMDKTTGVYSRLIDNMTNTDLVTASSGGFNFHSNITRGATYFRGVGKVVIAGTTYYAALLYYAAQSGTFLATPDNGDPGTRYAPSSHPYSLGAFWAIKMWAVGNTNVASPNIAWQWGQPASTYLPFMSSDGTYVYIGYVSSVSPYNFTINRYNTDGSGGITVASSTGGYTATDTTCVYVGAADFGATRYVIGGGQSDIWSVTGVGATNDAATTFPRANNENAWGLFWDGTQFRSINNSGKIYKYSAYTGATASKSVKYTWYDSDPNPTTDPVPAINGTHESLGSPPTNFTFNRRGWVSVITPLPPDGGGNNDPDSVRIYINDFKQTDLGPGVVTVKYGTHATSGTTIPTGTSGFAALATPGRIFSRAVVPGTSTPNISFKGDGTWFLANLVGMVVPYAASTAPDGFLMCNGAAVSRTAYAALFAVIGTTFGAGDGSTTFNIPDMRHRLPMGADGDLATSDGLVSTSRVPDLTHSHSHGGPSHTHPISGEVYPTGLSIPSTTGTRSVVSQGAYDGHNHGGNTLGAGTGSTTTTESGAHPRLHLYYIIKY